MGFKVLGFDSSTAVVTAGLVEDGRTLAEITFRGERLAGSRLVQWIQTLVAQGGRPDGIAVGIGPGSFTGVRVAISAAKALAFGWNVPVKGISSLAAWAQSVPHSGRVVVTSERRGPVFYLGYYYRSDNGVTAIIPDLAISGVLPEMFPLSDPVQVVGPASDDPALLAAMGPLATAARWHISGSELARLAWPGLQWGHGDDVFALSPSYLRPAAISRPTR